MPKPKRRHDLETPQTPYVLEYLCTCGKPMIFECQEKPEKLIKCFDCQEVNFFKKK